MKGRSIQFSLVDIETEQSYVSGTFFVQRQEGVSCFGDYYSPVVTSGKGEIRANLFHGVTLEHELRGDDTISLLMKFYVIEPSEDFPSGFKQTRLYKTAFCIGSLSGETKDETVPVGHTHAFVFNAMTVK